MNSIRPIIIKNIKIDFKKTENSTKFVFSKPCKLELTVFIKVKIPSLNALSNSMLNKVRRKIRNVRDKIKIITVKKYLFISCISIFTFENNTLFKSTCFGFECETSSLNENLVKRNILKNLKPELVETNDPPIITSTRNIKLFLLLTSNEKPIFDIVLINENKVIEKLLLSLKKTKKIATKKTK